MAAYAPEASHTLGLRLRVAFTRAALDREIAADASPWQREALALRATQLTSERMRERVARGLERAIASSARRGGAGVPVCRAAVLEARPALLALVDDLRDIRDPAPRGVALALALLSNGGGPLYRPWAPGELDAAAETARHAL